MDQQQQFFYLASIDPIELLIIGFNLLSLPLVCDQLITSDQHSDLHLNGSFIFCILHLLRRKQLSSSIGRAGKGATGAPFANEPAK